MVSVILPVSDINQLNLILDIVGTPSDDLLAKIESDDVRLRTILMSLTLVIIRIWVRWRSAFSTDR